MRLISNHKRHHSNYGERLDSRKIHEDFGGHEVTDLAEQNVSITSIAQQLVGLAVSDALTSGDVWDVSNATLKICLSAISNDGLRNKVEASIGRLTTDLSESVELNFEFVEDGADINIVVDDLAETVLGIGVSNGDDVAALRDEFGLNYLENGMIVLDQSLDSAADQIFNYVLAHEFGHVLGLKHPHDSGVNDGSSFGSVFLSKLDDDQFTVMSYNDEDSDLAQSFSKLDIYALGELYGFVNESDALELLDQITQLADLSVRQLYVLYSKYQDNVDIAFAQTMSEESSITEIRDTDGDDLILLSNDGLCLEVNNEGHTMETYGSHGIHLGKGHDHFIGNQDYNDVTGGADADLIETAAGDDVINLEAIGTFNGNTIAINISSNGGIQIGTEDIKSLRGYSQLETVVFGGDDFDTINLSTGNDAFFLHDSYSRFNASLELEIDSLGKYSHQRFMDIEQIVGGDGDDIVDLTSPDYSLAGQNITVDGGEGNDTLWGSDANETLKGGNGDDELFGGAGVNELIGGAGADEFQFTKTSINDTIADFNISDGDTLKFFNTGGAEFDRDSIALNSAGDELSIAYGSGVDDALTISLVDAGLQLDDLTADVLIIV